MTLETQAIHVNLSSAMRNMGILDGSYKDEIRNLFNSPRLVFINEVCGNLIVVMMMENLLE